MYNCMHACIILVNWTITKLKVWEIRHTITITKSNHFYQTKTTLMYMKVFVLIDIIKICLNLLLVLILAILVTIVIIIRISTH